MLLVTFLNITDPFNMEATPEPEYPASTPIEVQHVEERPADNYFPMQYDQTSGLEALSTAATGNYQYMRTLSVPGQSPPDANPSPHSNNLNFILNPAGPERSVGMYYSQVLEVCRRLTCLSKQLLLPQLILR
jgi:hypothetical protein